MTIRINEAHAIQLIAHYAQLELEAKVYCLAEYDQDDKLTGGVIIMNDNGWSAEIHVASFRPIWGTREFIWCVFNYVFRVRKIKKLFGRVPEENKKARKLNKHLGFIEECILDDVYSGGEGMVVMSMVESDCKYLNIKPPNVDFAPFEKTSVVEVHQYDPKYSESNLKKEE